MRTRWRMVIADSTFVALLFWVIGTGGVAASLLYLSINDVVCPAGMIVADCVEYRVEHISLSTTAVIFNGWIAVAFVLPMVAHRLRC